MAIARVQKAISQHNAENCVADTGDVVHEVTWPSGAPTEGNLLVAHAYSRGGAAYTWPAGWIFIASENQGSVLELRYKIAGASEPASLSVGLDTNTTDSIIGIVEYSGIDQSIPLDVFASNSSNAELTSRSTGTTAATDTADEVLVACFGVRDGGDVGTWSYTNSFVQLGEENTQEDGVCQPVGSSFAERIVSVTGTYETTASWTDAGRNLGIIAAFRAAAGGPAPQTINLTPAVASMSVPPVTVTPGPVSVDLTPAVGSMSVPDVSVVPGPVSIALTPAAAQFSAPDVSVVVGPISIDLSPAQATWGAPDVTVTPGGITVALTPASATWGVPDVIVSAGAVIDLTPAIANWSAPDVVVTPGGATVDLTPAIAAWGVPAVSVVPGPITVGLTPAAAFWTVPLVVVVQGGQTVSLTPAVAAWGAPPVIVTPGAVTIDLSPAVAVWGVPVVTVVNLPPAGLIPDVVRMVNVQLFMPGVSGVVFATPGATAVTLAKPGASGVTLEPN